MADCELLKGCLFFNDKMPLDSAMGRIYKQKYCTGDNSICARYMVASQLGRDKVPATMYPNMADQAKVLIAKG